MTNRPVSDKLAWSRVEQGGGMGRLKRGAGRLVRASRLVVRDERIPRPVRWCLRCSVVCLAIPGPVDEVLLLLLVLVVVVLWREPVVEAWRSAR